MSTLGQPPLPARWRPWQRRKNTCIYLLLRVCAWFWQRLPRCLAPPLALVLGSLAHALAGAERRRAQAHLALALPELGARARHRLGRRVFIHLARSLLELGRLDAWLADAGAIQIKPAAHRVLQEAIAEGRGVVAFSGHIGNWELMAQALVHAGYAISTVAKPLYDPRLTAWVDRLRRRHGLQLIWRGDRGDRGGVRALLQALRQRRILALLIDQDTRVAGLWVPFFGRPAFTPTAAAALALRRQLPLVLVWSQRVGNRHLIEAERIALDAGPGTLPWTEAALTERLSQRLEAVIRRAPEQWVWLHRRWRPPPDQADASIFASFTGDRGREARY